MEVLTHIVDFYKVLTSRGIRSGGSANGASTATGVRPRPPRSPAAAVRQRSAPALTCPDIDEGLRSGKGERMISAVRMLDGRMRREHFHPAARIPWGPGSPP
ncbi:hypothetical protein Slala03_11560 [Streptomyces lavendulae subsp. lavendulae]|nr:hypothetical protein Slala03_11560 [Streptomyces lavendulae subsp. lavendulae]